MLSYVFAELFRTKSLHTAKNYCDFQRFLLFRNKARNAGRSGKKTGNKPKCAISRMIAGRSRHLCKRHRQAVVNERNSNESVQVSNSSSTQQK